jgi:hypothetical protein
MLGAAALAVVTSGALLWVSGRPADLAGYLLATLVTVLFVAGFRSVDNRRRSRPTYVLPLLARRLPPPIVSMLLLASGVLVGGLHVWRFADDVARQ